MKRHLAGEAIQIQPMSQYKYYPIIVCCGDHMRIVPITKNLLLRFLCTIQFDFYWNQGYKGLNKTQAMIDMQHDLGVNALGRLRGDSDSYDNAQDACADYRALNSSFPKKYW